MATERSSQLPYFDFLREGWKHRMQLMADFISLTKPRILILLLISTCCPMVLAMQGTIQYEVMFWALISGALISGSASAVNCIYDRDIDVIMERTKQRPIPAGRLSVISSTVFALLIGFLGLFLMARFINPQAATVALFGHFFYVLIYTMWLKRSTPQNIVIGGAAGAVPPVVGWVAVTGEINLTAVLLFALVFLWTPPHFWALALNKNTDYQRAGIPMLPVVMGPEVTHLQMLVYSIALIPTTILLVMSDPQLGIFSMVLFLLLGGCFTFKIWQLKTMPLDTPLEHREKKAWDIFGFSLIYLACAFFTLVFDSVFF